MKYLILFFLSQTAGADEWFCKSQHAKRDGNVFSVCGVSIGWAAVPEDARWHAYNDAQMNFESICNLSSDCKDHKITVNPKRTDCYPNPSPSKLETCYQLIEVTVLN